jgi:hypothetical protein
LPTNPKEGYAFSAMAVLDPDYFLGYSFYEKRAILLDLETQLVFPEKELLYCSSRKEGFLKKINVQFH